MAHLSRNHRAARLYTEMAIPLFRLRNKVPFKGSHGELDGTTDASIIDAWWHETPDADIGVALRFTDLFVVDSDRRHFGDETLRALEVQHGDLPHTPAVISGSGGGSMHLYFRRVPALDGYKGTTLPCAGIDASGVDLKGLPYGYTVLPPSSHPSGREYQWEASSRLGDVAVADPPEWLINTILGRARKRNQQHHEPHEHDVDPESFYLGVAFKAAGLLGKQIKPGVFAVICPRHEHHTTGERGDGSSVLFAPETPGERGVFYCHHSSRCGGLR